MKHFLIVVDMQRDFIDGSLGTPEAVAILDSAAEKIRAFDGEIFVTLDTHDEDYLRTAEGRKLPVPHCIKDTEGWKLHPRIAAALEGRSYTAVEKHTFGAVKLPGHLFETAAGEDFDMELIGLCTDICVVSNALLLKAHFPEFPLRVDSACCAGVTPAAHAAALDTLRSCQVDII